MPISYIIKRHHAARRMILAVKENGQVVLTLPRRLAAQYAHGFVAAQRPWIEQQLQKVQLRQRDRPSNGSYHAYRARVLKFVKDKVNFWNRLYQCPVRGISIRRQTTRWGSASRAGRLNFNYQIFWLPEHLADYIIVHEICHLQEMNHSRRFWALVSETIPDHHHRRRKLHEYRCG